MNQTDFEVDTSQVTPMAAPMAPVEITLNLRPAREHCPMCDPCSPELDEEGRAYACYFCGDSGWVAPEVAAAYWQDRQDQAEYPRLRPQLVTRYDRFSGEVWEVKRTLLPASLLPAPKPFDWGPVEDIPW